MSKDNKHTQGSPGDFEDKIDSAMAGLEAASGRGIPRRRLL